MTTAQRANPRFGKRIMIRYGSEHTQWIGFTKDVSTSGFRIECRRLVRAGSLITFRFGDTPTVHTGRVVWTHRVHPALQAAGCFSEMGICFETEVQAGRMAA